MAAPDFFDEMRKADRTVRPAYAGVSDWLEKIPVKEMDRKRREAELLFRRLGITFAVYTEGGDTERLIPFDIVPRVLSADEWAYLERGLIQRVNALNAFLHDVYHDQEIIKAGRMPERLVLQNSQFRKEMVGIDLPRQIYNQIAGVDVVRTGESDFFVLEDNMRVPSGVSYMLEDREVMMRLFPDLFARNRVAPVSHYPETLLTTLRSMAPEAVREDPTVVLLTPGFFNSAYFEHAFLAEQMGIELVEGQDLLVRDGHVYMKTAGGLRRVDVIYRRIDDDFLDPTVFNPNSVLGVPGLFDCYAQGRVTLCNAVGTGIADDKAVYMYVPEMVRFYMGEEPILNNVPTYWLSNDDDLKYVLEHLEELVVKEVHGAGGYGMLVGPKASKSEVAAYRERVLKDPGAFIAQPTLALSTCPTFVADGIAPRHVDLRPFVLSGEQVQVVPGGLTRVAMAEGSLVVNSSQGGGTKDTWVLRA
ncbi:circularly permuted type 2 ATP-grasp protein [Marinibaculum pumilum]|uniref:Circularly permuted type 2 ATP-grasp protein n=1 Tax=Marinibaculum pumilum TaxID=1766165 RepID=A0ABV7L6K1_9PROT